jgi:hypothetical protein
MVGGWWRLELVVVCCVCFGWLELSTTRSLDCSFSSPTYLPTAPTAAYVGLVQTGFLRGFLKSSGGTGIVIPVKKVPQERKTQES